MELDRYIRQVFPSLPESKLRLLFSSRDVKLDGSPAKRHSPVREGQILKIYLPDDLAPETLRIVYEDDRILVVNKPAGISVENDTHAGLSLTELCRKHVNHSADSSVLFPAACHRLDVKTSGLCMFAKDEQALQTVQDAFRSHKVIKEYICLVRGVMKPPSAVCRAYLLKDAIHGKVRIIDRDLPGSRPIITEYQSLESGPVSRLRIHLLTGRTHQIRAHMAALGHPVLGDDLYGDHEFNRQQKARTLKLCSVLIAVDTNGALPGIDGRTFSIDPSF